MDKNMPLTIRKVIQQSISKRSIADTTRTFFTTNTTSVVMDHRVDITFSLKGSSTTFADYTSPDPSVGNRGGS
jgi:hypothetical protein